MRGGGAGRAGAGPEASGGSSFGEPRRPGRRRQRRVVPPLLGWALQEGAACRWAGGRPLLRLMQAREGSGPGHGELLAGRGGGARGLLAQLERSPFSTSSGRDRWGGEQGCSEDRSQGRASGAAVGPGAGPSCRGAASNFPPPRARRLLPHLMCREKLDTMILTRKLDLCLAVPAGRESQLRRNPPPGGMSPYCIQSRCQRSVL